VMCFGFNDHCAPPLQLLVRVVHAIDEWLSLDPENCAFIHCKAGRGRTGTVIASYLLWCGYISVETSKGYPDPVSAALSFFAHKRSRTGTGVMVPSQKRYVCYFYQLMISMEPVILNRKLSLAGIVLTDLPEEFLNGLSIKITDLEVVPSTPPIIVPNLLRKKSPFQILDNGDLFLSFQANHIILEGDVLVTVRCKKKVPIKTKHTRRLCRFAFHTAFINRSVFELGKHELDGGYRNQLKDSRFPSTFKIKLLFSDTNWMAPEG